MPERETVDSKASRRQLVYQGTYDVLTYSGQVTAHPRHAQSGKETSANRYLPNYK